MTDRISTVTVALKESTREDDARQLIAAILCLRGVLSVTTNAGHSARDWAADQRAMAHYREKLMAVLWPKEDPR